MNVNKGKIGIKEYVALISLTIGAKLSDDTPAILFENAKNAGWMSVILIGTITLIPIILLMKVFAVHREKNLHEVILHLFGKFFGNIISVLLLVMGTSAIIIDSAVYVDIIGTMYFTKTPPLIIYGMLMFVCAYGAKRGIEQIGTLSWLMLPYIKLTLLIAMIFTIKEGNKGFLFPLWGEGKIAILKATSKNVSIFSDFLFVTLIVPFISSFKDFKKGTFIALILVIVEITLAMVSFVMLFDYTTAELLNYPFHETIRYIQVGFLENVETFFFPFWLVATFIRFSLYLYLCAVLLGGILKIEEFEYLIPLIGLIIVLIGIAPESPSIVLFDLRKKILLLITPAFMALPPAMWLLAKIRGDFKSDSTQVH